jgi:hypothetical protein
MNDVLRALSISAGILFLVVVLTVVVSMAAVKRGEAGMLVPAHDMPEPAPPVKAAAGKAAAAAGDEISVSQILLLGLGLFTVTILALLVVSLIQHM